MVTNEEQNSSTGSMEPEHSTLEIQPAGIQTASHLPVQTQAESTQLSSDKIYGLPFTVASDDGKEEFEVRLFNCAHQNVEALWQVCREYKVMLPDSVREDYSAFLSVLMAPSTVVVTLGNVGIAYATSVVPTESAMVHYLFWDKKQRNRQKLLLRCINWLMLEFALHRVNISIPRFASAALHRVKCMGFKLEGIMREALLHNGRWADCFIFGVLASELTPEVLESGYIKRSIAESEWFGALNDDERLRRKVMER